MKALILNIKLLYYYIKMTYHQELTKKLTQKLIKKIK